MRTLILAAMLFLAGVAQAAEPVPVTFGQIPELDACGTQGVVQGLNPKGDNFLAVRDGPGTAYSKIDEIDEQQWVILCDAEGDWIGIVYDESDELDCGTGSPIAEPRIYDGPCKSGWVSSKFVLPVAG